MVFFPQSEQGVACARSVFEEGCAEAGRARALLARGPRRPARYRRDGARLHAHHPTGVSGAARGGVSGRHLRAQALRVPPHHREAGPRGAHALKGQIFYICSMSSRTIVYKGMLVATQMRRFFSDLNDAARQNRRGARALALLHQHDPQLGARPPPTASSSIDGEINTLKGNVNWIRAANRTSTRRCSALTSPACFPSSTARDRTPPSSTTCSSSSS